ITGGRFRPGRFAAPCASGSLLVAVSWAMASRTKLLLGMALTLGPSILLGAACGGEVVGPDGGSLGEGGATCESVCAEVIACDGMTDESQAECAASCESQEAACAKRGAGSEFESLLSCVS